MGRGGLTFTLCGTTAHVVVLSALPLLIRGVELGWVAGVAAWVGLGLLEGPNHDDGGTPLQRARALAVLVSMIASLSVPSAVGSWFVLGAVLFGAGALARLWTVRTLGPRFISASVSGPRLRTGPFALCDHPSDLGLLASVVGVWLIAGPTLVALAPIGVLTALTAVQVRREEAALRAAVPG